MKENNTISEIRKSVKSSFEKISSYPEEVISKWRIGRKNFP